MSASSTTRPHFDDVTIVWFGEMNGAENSVNTQLHRVSNSLQIFSNAKKCVNYIRLANNENILLVIPNTLTQKILPHVHKFPQLISIYVASVNAPSVSEERSTTYTKMRGVFSDVVALSEHLMQDIRVAEANNTPISILSASSVSSEDINTLDPLFMYSQLLKEILFEFEYNEEAHRRFIEFCRELYTGNGRELHIISEFNHNYHNHSPAWWYTRECFLYKMLNKALRTHDINILCKMGFFIRDLHQQLEQLHATTATSTPLVLYRGQGMFNNEFKKLRKNVGSLLSFNNLLSTSTNRDVSVRFAQHSLGKDDMTAVLFEMHIDPSVRSTPFALLNGISYFPAEEEILFSMHSVFRIQDIEQMHNHIWNIRLTLTSDDDPQLRQLTDFMRREIRGPNATHRLALYMLNAREWDKAKEIYEVLYRDVPPERTHELAFIEHSLGMIYDEKGDLERAVTHYKKSLDIEMTYLPNDHPQLAPTYGSLACVYEKQGKFDLAMEQYRHALTIELNSTCPDKHKIATRYMNMGDLLHQRGRLDEARKSVNHALKIQLEILPSIHPDLVTTYGHLCNISYSMRDYSSALEQAKEQLRIAQKCYSPNHMVIAVAHNHVSAALDKLEQYQEALKEAEKAVEIGRYTYPLGHPEMRAIDNSLTALRRINRQLFGDH